MRRRLFWLAACLVCFILAAHLLAQGHSDVIQITSDVGNQNRPKVAYNTIDDDYLVVWQDQRNGTEYDIYGQFVHSDGTLIGENFAICTATGTQEWPDVAFDPVLERYFVVWGDYRNGALRDVYGIFLTSNGAVVEGIADAEEDGAFPVSNHPADMERISVAFNSEEGKYLVVWGDWRGNPDNPYDPVDIYGQIVASDGTLLPPPDPAGAGLNFPIANSPDYIEAVPDVAYSPITNEWLVAYGTSLGYVYGQRVDAAGQLLGMDGLAAAKPAGQNLLLWFVISILHYNGPYCLNVNLIFRIPTPLGLSKTAEVETECEVVWKGVIQDMTEDNDVYGQRLRFVKQEASEQFVVEYVDISGEATDGTSNHAISLQNDWVGPADITYSPYDDEYLVGWGDPRTHGYGGQDLAYQRLWLDENDDMIWLADDRVSTVANTENIVIYDTDTYEGSWVGLAHSTYKNSSLIAFTFDANDDNPSTSTDEDLYAHLVYGTVPTPVEEREASLPETFEVFPNYPNPFNPETKVRFALPETGRVKVTVFDMTGRKVTTLVDGVREAGIHSLLWDGKDGFGKPLPSGIFVCRVKFGDRLLTRKMTLIR